MAHISGDRSYEAPAPLVWDVITDSTLYGEVAPNLVAVEIESGSGEGMVRRCTDTNGNEWTEAVTNWEPERAYAVAVDVAGSPFHRRLFTRFEGRWELIPRGTRVTVRIGFDFEPRYGPFGRLIEAYFRYVAPGILEAIFDGWEQAIVHRYQNDTLSTEATGRTNQLNVRRDQTEESTLPGSIPSDLGQSGREF